MRSYSPVCSKKSRSTTLYPFVSNRSRKVGLISITDKSASFGTWSAIFPLPADGSRTFIPGLISARYTRFCANVRGVGK